MYFSNFNPIFINFPLVTDENARLSVIGFRGLVAYHFSFQKHFYRNFFNLFNINKHMVKKI